MKSRNNPTGAGACNAVHPFTRGCHARGWGVRVVLTVIVAAVATEGVHAWGPVGHRAVAEIARARLTAAVRSEIQRLLGGASMADVAVWADEVRETTHPETANWHIVNTPITTSGYLASRDCQPLEWGDCILAALPRLEVRMRNARLPIVQRRETLMFLIHLIGDLHQPLHVGENGDRGGNQRRLAPIGGSENLHSAWDSGIIRDSRGSIRSLASAAAAWLETQTASTLTAGRYEDWAAEGFRVSRDFVYPQIADGRISVRERDEAMRVIERRIAMAGARLAAVLNRTLARP